MMVGLLGCGASWQLVDELDGDCRRTWTYFVDADGDGWGDPGQGGVHACGPLTDQARTARNGLDCDDGDPSVMAGGAGTVCAETLLTGDAEVVGATSDTMEVVMVVGDVAYVTPDLAEDACGRWGEDGTLATMDDVGIREQLRVGAAGRQVWAYVAGRWEGAGVDGLAGSYVPSTEAEGTRIPGAWSGRWVAVDGLLEDVGWCDGEPVPGDAFPSVNPEDEANAAFWDDVLPTLRLVLQGQDDGAWCLGLPAAEDGVSTLQASLICERTWMDPADYAGRSVEDRSADPD